MLKCATSVMADFKTEAIKDSSFKGLRFLEPKLQGLQFELSIKVHLFTPERYLIVVC